MLAKYLWYSLGKPSLSGRVEDEEHKSNKFWLAWDTATSYPESVKFGLSGWGLPVLREKFCGWITFRILDVCMLRERLLAAEYSLRLSD